MPRTTIKQLKHYLKQPITTPAINSKGKKFIDVLPNISTEFRPDLPFPEMRKGYAITTPYYNAYGTGIGMSLYYYKGHWYLSDSLNLEATRGSLALDFIASKGAVKLFNKGIKDAEQMYGIKAVHKNFYVYKLNNLKELNEAYVAQVNFQMWYLQVLYFLVRSNQGYNKLSAHVPKDNKK